MDNWYSALPLFVILCDDHDILCSGTVQMNQQGLPKKEMKLSLKSNKLGKSLVLYDETNMVLALQWCNNEVVSCFLYSKGREINLYNFQWKLHGSIIRIEFEVLIMVTNIVKWVHWSLITKMVQMSGFWYLWFYDSQFFFAWNMSTSDVPQLRKVKKDKFYMAVAQELVHYQVNQSDLGELWQEEMHLPNICPSSVTRLWYATCALEMGVLIKTGGSEVFGKLFRSQKDMAWCSQPEWKMFAHNLSFDNDRKIFDLPEIKVKYNTCFDVFHPNKCKSLCIVS